MGWVTINGAHVFINSNEIASVINAVLTTNSHSAVKYCSDRRIIRATRRTYKRKYPYANYEITVTIGRPNYKERKFIRLAKKAGEPFPIKKIQLR